MSDNELNMVMLGSDNPTTWIVYNHLVRKFGLFPILIERPVPRKVMLRNRMHKLGRTRVMSQILFIATLRRFLNWRDRPRIRTICRTLGLEAARPLTSAILPIDSVNDEECRSFLREIRPNVIVVNGTRIIGSKTLKAVSATFINTHHGITPKYRGAHGAYWALLNDDRADCGVTVHVVDEGIDTGDIIGQARIEPVHRDSFVTYPYLLTAKALPILVKAIEDVSSGRLVTTRSEGESGVWYHPGFFQYLCGWMRGVR